MQIAGCGLKLQRLLGEENLMLPFWSAVIIAIIASYLFGCFNGAIVISKYVLHNDVRKHGSGNAGITNFYRTFGGPLTFLVLLCDVLKMVGGVLLARFLLAPFGLYLEATYIAGLFVVLGHTFPVFFSFRGGKGILSGGTLTVMIDWRVALIAIGIFLITVILTRWVSLGSIFATISFPIAVSCFLHPGTLESTISFLISAMIIFMHRENIKRLIRGEENRFSFHRKRS